MAEIMAFGGCFADGTSDAHIVRSEVLYMKAKILRILSVTGLIIAMGSLSACFEESYHPGYGYRGPAYAYPEPYPQYYPEYVPAPRAYAYNPHRYSSPHPYSQYRQRWEREEHHERARREHRDHDRF
jgi:hypothetical protein